MRNFETELPESYDEIFSIDATNKKIGIILNLIALAVMLIIGVPLVTLILINNRPLNGITLGESTIVLIVMFAYIVLHELVHGAAYYLLTRHKLSFGVTLTVAFCGVPDIYVYKRAALIAVLAPFVVFDAVFILGMLLVTSTAAKIMFALMFALHFGGCVGDLYDAYLLIFRFKGNILMRDTGPKQTFYSDVPQT